MWILVIIFFSTLFFALFCEGLFEVDERVTKFVQEREDKKLFK